MSKLVLNNIEAGYLSNTAYNANNDLIVNALENTLSRDGTAPNQMGANIDMNSNRILNLPYAASGAEPITLQQAVDLGGSIVLSTNDASLINYVPPGTGAVTRSVESKLREDLVSVEDYGGTGDGVADDTSAFSLAAKAASASMNINGARGTAIVHADIATVFVPAGTWNITSEVDTNNREIVWECDSGAVFLGDSENFLSGRINRPGYRNSGIHHGNLDYATGFSIACNQRQGFHDYSPGVLGFATGPSQISTSAGGGSVGMFVENSSVPVLVNAASATYTATTAIIPTPSATALKKYRKGMVLKTKHGTPWLAFLESWNADGSVLTVQTGWYQYGGGGVASTPTNDGTGLYVNAFQKAWAHNANIHLLAAADAPTTDTVAGFELGMLNYRGDSTIPFVDVPNRCWGFDSVSLGTFRPHSAFIARSSTGTNNWQHGFYAVNANYGFKYQGSGAVLQAVRPTTEQVFYQVTSTGSVEMGNQSVASSPYIDFRSSGLSSDYDARISTTGGAAATGQGTMSITAGLVNLNSTMNFTAATTESRWLSIGTSRAGSGYSYVDLVGDTTYTDFGTRLMRGNTGANALSVLQHRGTGALALIAQDAGSIDIQTNSISRLGITSGGVVSLPGSTTEDKVLRIGEGRAGDGASYVDLVGDATYTSYGTRLVRAAGANGESAINHRGTGNLVLRTQDAAGVVIQTSGVTRMSVAAGGDVSVVNLLTAGSLTTTGTFTATNVTTAGDLFLNSGGNVKFGTHSALAAEVVTGYITIKDAAGNLRKLAVVS